jgi:hypothetical protein
MAMLESPIEETFILIFFPSQQVGQFGGPLKEAINTWKQLTSGSPIEIAHSSSCPTYKDCE